MEWTRARRDLELVVACLGAFFLLYSRYADYILVLLGAHLFLYSIHAYLYRAPAFMHTFTAFPHSCIHLQRSRIHAYIYFFTAFMHMVSWALGLGS